MAGDIVLTLDVPPDTTVVWQTVFDCLLGAVLFYSFPYTVDRSRCSVSISVEQAQASNRYEHFGQPRKESDNHINTEAHYANIKNDYFQ